MEFRVLSRVEIESDYYMTIKESSMPHIILSTTSDRDKPIVKIKENPFCKGILRFEFDDICLFNKKKIDITEGLYKHAYKYNIFTKDDAKSILNFVNSNINNIEAIITHCDAGICRSSAMAAALSKILLDEDDYFFKNYMPNSLVYTAILTEYFYNEDIYKNMFNYNSKNYRMKR